MEPTIPEPTGTLPEPGDDEAWEEVRSYWNKRGDQWQETIRGREWADISPIEALRVGGTVLGGVGAFTKWLEGHMELHGEEGLDMGEQLQLLAMVEAAKTALTAIAHVDFAHHLDVAADILESLEA